ncbi:MAG: CTP synthase [Oligosphaeraceae bacterium]|nr:CTP synthase [Oligosphaeraceae bacterium]
MSKHIFITGGVVSSLGKGITAASLALLLKSRGYRVAMQKLDPYLNVDPGTMSPYQHGEVFVTDDGAETDLDLGHYERFAGIACTKASNYTAGKIYSNVIARERQGGYLGKTVQVIPHITDEIKQAFAAAANDQTDIVISEIGGTAGDIESMPFLEAARQFKLQAGAGNAVFIHLTLLPYIKAAGELKTKPSQQSVGILRNIGIIPDLLVCRTELPMSPEHRQKLSLFCNVPEDMVIEERDVQHSIYEVPTALAEHGFDLKVLSVLHLPPRELKLGPWEDLLERVLKPQLQCRIAVVGKYMHCRDAYKSIYEALSHAGMAHWCKVTIDSIEAEELETSCERLQSVDGILVPGGFGNRGIAGKLAACRYARENDIPLLGICLGLQCVVIEFARNVLGWQDADSTEFNPGSTHPVIDLLPEQRGITELGGSMRLGGCPCRLIPGSKAAQAYSCLEISERHRHRYEFNNQFREALSSAGLQISGSSPNGELVEVVELGKLRFYVACQFHPEFKSRPTNPHPLFAALVRSCLQARKNTSTADSNNPATV